MLVGLLFAEFRHHCKALIRWLCNIFLKLTLCYKNCFYPKYGGGYRILLTVIGHEEF